MPVQTSPENPVSLPHYYGVTDGLLYEILISLQNPSINTMDFSPENPCGRPPYLNTTQALLYEILKTLRSGVGPGNGPSLIRGDYTAVGNEGTELTRLDTIGKNIKYADLNGVGMRVVTGANPVNAKQVRHNITTGKFTFFENQQLQPDDYFAYLY